MNSWLLNTEPPTQAGVLQLRSCYQSVEAKERNRQLTNAQVFVHHSYGYSFRLFDSGRKDVICTSSRIVSQRNFQKWQSYDYILNFVLFLSSFMVLIRVYNRFDQNRWPTSLVLEKIIRWGRYCYIITFQHFFLVLLLYRTYMYYFV